MESANLNFYFRSGRTVFPMCYLDRISKDLSNDAILFAIKGKNLGANHPLGMQRRKIGRKY